MAGRRRRRSNTALPPPVKESTSCRKRWSSWSRPPRRRPWSDTWARTTRSGPRTGTSATCRRASSASIPNRGSSPSTSCPRTRARRPFGSSARRRRRSDDLVLATDYDREGEAIAFHVAEILERRSRQRQAGHVHRDHQGRDPRRVRAPPRDRPPARRGAAGAADPRPARRLPDLPDPVEEGPSADSPPAACSRSPLRLIVDREREIRAFTPVEYWSVDVRLTPDDAEKPRSSRA